MVGLVQVILINGYRLPFKLGYGAPNDFELLAIYIYITYVTYPSYMICCRYLVVSLTFSIPIPKR